MSLETEHRGYKIRYGENSDEWSSYDAGDGMSAPTLSKLKEKIDRMIAKAKNATAFNCLAIVNNGYQDDRCFEVAEAKVTGYTGPVVGSKDGYSSTKVVKGHKVDAVYVRRTWAKANPKASRQSVELGDLCRVGPETDAAIAEANRLGREAVEAVTRHRAALKAIPRLTLDDIAELVKLSGIDPTGGLK